jgi:hypothetical protein
MLKGMVAPGGSKVAKLPRWPPRTCGTREAEGDRSTGRRRCGPANMLHCRLGKPERRGRRLNRLKPSAEVQIEKAWNTVYAVDPTTVTSRLKSDGRTVVILFRLPESWIAYRLIDRPSGPAPPINYPWIRELPSALSLVGLPRLGLFSNSCSEPVFLATLFFSRTASCDSLFC